jgi:prevent-host-death family protein
MEQIGIRELRQNASKWIRRVKQGESFEITEHGDPVAVLGPRQPMSRLDELEAQGLLIRGTGNLLDIEPELPSPGGMTGSEALALLRADER